MLCRVRRPIGPFLAAIPKGTLALTLVAITVCGCSSDSADQAEPAQQNSTASVPLLCERNAPLQVSVKKVAGRLSKSDRAPLKRAASRPIRIWMDAGFVGGSYPRADFSSTYQVFTAGAARSAKQDRALLSNIRLGRRVVDVVAKRRTAQLAVLAVHGQPAGVSARVHLRLLAFHRDGSRTIAQVEGELYLTRAPDGHWKIFGYDLTREAGSR